MESELIKIGFERPDKDYKKKYQVGLWLIKPEYDIWWDGTYFRLHKHSFLDGDEDRLLHNVRSIDDVEKLVYLLS